MKFKASLSHVLPDVFPNWSRLVSTPIKKSIQREIPLFLVFSKKEKKDKNVYIIQMIFANLTVIQ
jgi:hypothetical protein